MHINNKIVALLCAYEATQRNSYRKYFYHNETHAIQDRVTAARTSFTGCCSATAGDCRWLTVQTMTQPASSRGKPVLGVIHCLHSEYSLYPCYLYGPDTPPQPPLLLPVYCDGRKNTVIQFT